MLIKLNVAAALYRRNSQLHDIPLLEVAGCAAITAAISYLVSEDSYIWPFSLTFITGCFSEVEN
jgi:hypothetical protein